MVEDLAVGMIRVVGIRAEDVDVDLLQRGIDGPSRRRASRQGIHRGQCVVIAHALGHHEMDLAVLVDQLVVERGRARSLARDIEQAFQPVHVTTPGIPVLVDERGDVAVLARGRAKNGSWVFQPIQLGGHVQADVGSS